ncbi:MAG: 2-hydroxychromene-2-carboxylate isomerase [Caulobacteraceae bacterium]
MPGGVETIEFFFDFGSPNAFLAHRAIPAIEARTGARFSYQPMLLGGVFKATGNRSPGEVFAGVPAKLAFMAVETRRFVARHGITDYRPNPFFPVITLSLMRGALAARRLTCFEPYVEAVFQGMWSEGRKMDDPDVFRSRLQQAGLDAVGLIALSGTAEVKQELIAATEGAVARGVFGAPSFFVGEEMFFGKDQLRDVEETWLAQCA